MIPGFRMTISRATKYLLLLFATASFVSSQDIWKKIENQSFSFSIPLSLSKTEARGKDSFVQEYASDDLRIIFDFGIYSNDFSDWSKDTSFEKVEINGRSARIGTVKHEIREGYPYSAQIYVKTDRYTALSIFAACKSEKEVLLAKRVFRTLKFK